MPCFSRLILISSPPRVFLAIVAFTLGGLSSASAQVLFTETFDDPSSADRFNVTSIGMPISPNDPAFEAPADVYSEFGFDYSAMGGSRLTQSILTATTGMPSGGGSTTGLLLAANIGGNRRSSINLYPIISGMGLPTDDDTGLPVIDGNYRMTFDFFAGVNGTGDLQEGGAGTTEYLQVGAQSDGDGRHMNGFTVMEPDSDFIELNTNGDLLTSDGILFTTRGGGPLLDSPFIPHSSEVLQAAFPRPDFLGEDRHTDVAAEDGVPDGVPDGGAPAERWSTAEVTHIDGITTFFFNGVEVGTIEFSDFGNDLGTNGLPWIGYTDFFNSAAGNDSPNVADAGGGNPVGDFNENGIVDAADYTRWRDTLGQLISLPNEESTPDEVTAEDYQDWVDHFGETVGSAATFDPLNASFAIIDNVVIERVTSELGAGSLGTVPEPSTGLLALLAALGAARTGRRGFVGARMVRGARAAST